MAGNWPYSLVVIDSCMPGMNGFEASTEIKRIAPTLPIVMLTSDARPGDAVRRVTSGLSGYAVKPASRTTLLRLICDALEAQGDLKPGPAERIECTEKEPAMPARILVAEDSADNRLLVQVYLNGSPYRLTFEENGEAAVERFTTGDFDLILMDVQMPVMDGLAAARAIRQIEREGGLAPIPILALTANAAVQDAEESLAAGCTTHLSKPISKVELLTAIEKYARRRVPRATEPVQPLQPISISIPRGFEGIAPNYVANCRKEVPEMLQLLTASDFKRLATLGHNMKGCGGAYGLPNITRLGAAVEDSAKQENAPALASHITELQNYLDRVHLVEES
jgi:CheY-like chemotaxis protein